MQTTKQPQRKYTGAQKVKRNAESRAFYLKNKTKMRSQHRAWVIANPTKMKTYKAQDHSKLRAAIITRLGGCCARCSSVDNLEFDHIHDNGGEHRMEVNGVNERNVNLYRWMRDAPLSEVKSGQYAIQLLCNECHRTKDKWSQKLDLFFKEAA